MKKIIVYLMIGLLSLPLPSISFGAAGDCNADGDNWTFVTGSATDEHFQTCVNTADEDDTITLQSGSTATWDGQVNITKGLKIVGATTGCPSACVDNTVINSNGITDVFYITITPGTSVIEEQPEIDISGITFVSAYYGTNPAIHFYQPTYSTDPVYGNFRIHHNKFVKYRGAVAYEKGIGYGLIDHNLNYQGSRLISSTGNNQSDWYRFTGSQDCVSSPCHLLWDDLEMSSDKFMIVEDNVSSDNEGFAIQVGQGGRFIIRHNSFDSKSSVTVDDEVTMIDAHCTNYGCPAIEIYDNSITYDDDYIDFYFTPIQARCGAVLMYNNTVTQVGTSTNFGNLLRSFYEQGYGCDAYHDLSKDVIIELHDSYYFNNTYNGSRIMFWIQDGTGEDDCLQTGDEYYSDTQDNSTSAQDAYDVWNQASAPTENLDAGDIWWDSDDNELYKYTMGWGDPIYVEYQYPAPAQGAGDTTAPTLESATIGSSGTTLTCIFDEAVTTSSSTGLTIEDESPAIGITYYSGSGSDTIVYSTSRVVYLSGVEGAITLDYNSGTGDIVDTSSNALATFSDFSITNNSTQSLPGPPEGTMVSGGSGNANASGSGIISP